MTALAIDKLWRFLQSLSLTASNERWLAERLLESANAKIVLSENVKEEAWSNYQLYPLYTSIRASSAKRDLFSYMFFVYVCHHNCKQFLF